MRGNHHEVRQPNPTMYAVSHCRISLNRLTRPTRTLPILVAADSDFNRSYSVSRAISI
jgi:hypothetical protein